VARLTRELAEASAERDGLLARIEVEGAMVREWGRRHDAALEERDRLRALLGEIGINCGICMCCGRVISREGHNAVCRLNAELPKEPQP
jgi:hypothetical protein